MSVVCLIFVDNTVLVFRAYLYHVQCGWSCIGHWPFGLALCATWQIADVTCCTSSIMHMCTISLDRYTALRRPLIARARRTSVAGVWTRVGFVWTLSFGIASPLIVVSIRRPAAMLSADRQCVIGYAPFLAYGSLAAFFCPLAVMLATYALTTRLLRRRAAQAERQSRDGSLRRTTSQRRHRRHDNFRVTVGLSHHHVRNLYLINMNHP